MREPSISIRPEGASIIGLTALSALVFAMLDYDVPAIISLVLTAFSLNFFRDPERVVPDGPGLAVSPADGKTVMVGPAKDPLSGQERTRVCVFMNVFNVHVNRFPVSGRVQALEYVPGAFFNASLDKASDKNERLIMRIRDEDGAEWTVVQIAGLVARRIVSQVRVGDELSRGDRFGMIKFGSRLDVYLPQGWEPALAVGERILAGQGVIARKK